MKNFIASLAEIQLNLKAPKNQFNSFGKYSYRNCDDILEAVKPLLNGLLLTISDEIVQVGSRIYIKATVTITDGENSVSNSALAREAETKKGMDDAQITGAASSYARKYALNGLFCIDDNKDADSFDNSKPLPKMISKVSPPHPKIDLVKFASDCGWTVEQVCNSFDPPLKSINDVQDVEACAAFLKANSL